MIFVCPRTDATGFRITIESVLESAVFFAYISGRQVGPMTKDDLEGRARRGEISAEDLVWQTGTLGWVKAIDVLGAEAFEPPPDSGTKGPAVIRVADLVPEKVRTLLTDLSSFSLSELVPFRRLLDPETLGVPVAWMLLVFGLGPLFLGTVLEDPAVKVRLFNAGCGALWTAFFVAAFKTKQHSARIAAALFFLNVVLAALLVSLLPAVPPLSWLHRFLRPDQPFAVLLASCTGGLALLEEVGKGLLLLFLAHKTRLMRNSSGGVFYGLMSGLGFGFWEAVVYTEWMTPLQAASLAAETGSVPAALFASFVSSAVRILSIPLLHAIWTAIAGYFIGLSFVLARKTTALLVTGFAVSTLLHGLYSTFLASGLGFFAFLAAVASLLLFLAYRRNEERLAEEVRLSSAS